MAWFSPLPPDPSGIASYSADLLPLLDASGSLSIDRFVDRPGASPGSARGGANVFNAHDFVWKHHRDAYDLVVYQLGNAGWHDYMWAYLVAYPGLVVLHDTGLHHARARQLLRQGRMDDYRAEFRYDHPDAAPGVEEYAVEGLSGSIYYFWSMLPAVLRTSRLVAVHNARIAADLSAQHPDVRIETIRMGVPTSQPADGSQERGRTLRRALGIGDSATVFVAFGHVTSEKRIDPILRAVSELAAKAHDIHLLLVGPAEGFPALGGLVERQGLAARVHVTGYVDDRRVADYFAAADACLCLRWPTAGETSASWLRALAAGRPTVITKLAHLADVPTLDAATSRPSHASRAPVALSVDLLDEDAGLLAAMSKLSTDGQLRADLAGSGHAYWAREHALELMAIDYLRILREAAARETPRVSDLPAHFTDDYSVLVRRIEDEMGVGRRI